VGQSDHRQRVGVGEFQSPSRGGHLRGAPRPLRCVRSVRRFSPLLEGDTSVGPATRSWSTVGSRVSVPFSRGTPPWGARSRICTPGSCRFQSPSRGGHLRGQPQGAVLSPIYPGFSPLLEGDTSVGVEALGASMTDTSGFSPLLEGDTSVGRQDPRSPRKSASFSPLLEGDTSVGGLCRRLRGWNARFSPLLEGDTSVGPPLALWAWAVRQVSVPFSRGTPPWGGRLRGRRLRGLRFSPLLEGDTSVG